MSTLRLVESENIREKLTLEESKKIEKMYRNILKDIEKDVKSIEAMENASSTIKIGYLVDMESTISKKLKEIQKELGSSIPSAMYDTSLAVVDDINSTMKKVGLSIQGAYFNLPDDIVRNVISGQLYEKDWSLSKAIWMHTQKAQDDVYSIVAQGIAQNRPIYDIAKDLERYVNPSAKKPWDWSKMYPGVNKKVDYNAQRLANTMISHAYQQSFIATTKNNPFFTGYKWLTSHSHRGVCEVCRDRAESDQYGLGIGVFPKDQLPLDHPNGVCTYAIVLAKNMSGIVNDIANWYHSPNGTFPEIDKYADSLVKSAPIKNVKDFVSKYGQSQKTTKSWLNDIPKEQKEIAKILKKQSGLTWEDWYKKYIYNGDGKNLAKAAANKAKHSSKVKKFSAEDWKELLKKNKMPEFEKWYDDWVKLLTPAERNGVRTYTGGAYRSMNSFLRGFRDYSEYEDEIRDAIQAMNKASLPRDTIVRRGSDSYSLKGMLGIDDLSKVVDNKESFIGSIAQDKGFMSTSPDPEGGFSDDIEYVINVPKGSKAMYIAPLSHFRSEKELLLQAGTKFIVKDIEINSYNRIKRVYMEVLN